MKIYFAPMEGVTDGILRQAHHRIFGGIDTYCLPFHKLTQSLSLLTREKRDVSPEENEGLNVLPQALTRDPEQLSAWLYYISECGYACADLNIGCPSPTVTQKGRGSGMLRDPDYLRSFFDRLFSSTLPVSLSVKTRIGYESTDEWPAIAGLLADYPFAHVTIHARTTREQYAGPVHPEAFRLAVQDGVPHPVYNGDLRTVADVHELLRICPETEAVMIGRGLLANPALPAATSGGKGCCAGQRIFKAVSMRSSGERLFLRTGAESGTGRRVKTGKKAGCSSLYEYTGKMTVPAMKEDMYVPKNDCFDPGGITAGVFRFCGFRIRPVQPDE